MNIWLLTNVPTPYQVELFRAVEEQDGVSLHVRYMRTGGVDLSSGADVQSVRVVSGIGPRSWRDEVRLHPLALWECLVGRYDCYVLSGLCTSITLEACSLLLWMRRRPTVVWLERPHAERFRISLGARSRWQDTIRRIFVWIRSSLLERSDAVFCVGSLARRAYAALGVPAEKLFVLPYCCDITRFECVDSRRVDAVRKRYSLVGKTVLLFSGQMVPRKGVDVLLQVFQRVAAQRPSVALLLLGDGPGKKDYESTVKNELSDRVCFAGFVEQHELPAYFAAADVFVFPSRHDGWGVVINEACAAGLPIVASGRTGAAEDLVEDGKSGFLLDSEDIEAFVDRLLLLIDDPALRQQYGKRSRELVEPFSAANGAGLFLQHLRDVLAERGNGRIAAAEGRHVP